MTTTKAPQKKGRPELRQRPASSTGRGRVTRPSSVVEITPDAINDWLEVDFEAERAQLHLTGFIEFTDQSLPFVAGIG